jgi:phosphohistidine phosphatase SixA
MRRTLLLTGLLTALGALPAAAQASYIVLVRHAEKATGGGNDPPLSTLGNDRAEALAAAVAQSDIQHVLVTEYRRTSETAAIVTAATGLVPQVVRVGDLRAGEHAAAVAAALDALPAGTAALVVGHSNTIPPIIAALGGPSMPDLRDDEYATIFVLDRSAGTIRFVRASYGVATPGR